jgi:hypothetical protein
MKVRLTLDQSFNPGNLSISALVGRDRCSSWWGLFSVDIREGRGPLWSGCDTTVRSTEYLWIDLMILIKIVHGDYYFF